jgi:methylmalonyl-CoA mutase N-terminal domain/subunit
MKVALRTQQILLEETGIAGTIDPLGGSYAIEALTDAIEAGAREYLERIDDLGGTVACIESGFFQQEIADAAYRQQLAKEAGDLRVVGVNAYRDADAAPAPFELHRVDPEVERRKVEELASFRAGRDGDLVAARLAALQAVAATDANLMPATIEAARARATGGEIVEAIRAVFGSYVEHAVF